MPVWQTVDAVLRRRIPFREYSLGLMRRTQVLGWHVLGAFVVIVEHDANVERSLHLQLHPQGKIDRRVLSKVDSIIKSLNRSYEWTPSIQHGFVLGSVQLDSHAAVDAERRALDAWFRKLKRLDRQA